MSTWKRNGWMRSRPDRRTSNYSTRPLPFRSFPYRPACPYTDTSPSLPIHAARNVNNLAFDPARYYAVVKAGIPCQDSRTLRLNPSPLPFFWSMTSRPSRCCARRYFSRQAFPSSMSLAVQRHSKSAHNTKGLSIYCSQTSSSPLQTFNWPQAPINSPTYMATNWPCVRSAYGKTCE